MTLSTRGGATDKLIIYYTDSSNYPPIKSLTTMRHLRLLLIALLLPLALSALSQRMYNNSGSLIARYDNGKIYDKSGTYIGKMESDRFYDSTGKKLGSVSNDRFYNSYGSTVGRMSDGKFYNSSGSYVGKVSGERVYNSQGSFLGKAADVPMTIVALIYFFRDSYPLR